MRLDLSKEFDASYHIILLKLILFKYYGIDEIELTWFKSYLIDMIPCVSFEETHSSMMSATTQSSIWGVRQVDYLSCKKGMHSSNHNM